MAQQLLNIGFSPNDGSGDPLRTAYSKINSNETELFSRVIALEGSMTTVNALVRSDDSVIADGTNGQTILFSSQFVDDYSLSIYDKNGIGITVISKDKNGFTIDSVESGNFGYIAIVEE